MEQSTPTRAALAAAYEQLKYFECGGESKFATVEEGRQEIQRLRLLRANEEHEELLGQREELRREMIEADIEIAVTSAAWSAAREKYARLKASAANCETSLRMTELTQAEGAA